jgi:AraC-like DNA-binding protein
MATAKILHLPRRPRTVKRYLDIVRYAHEKKQGLTSVAKHFGISPATVINASKAFGMTYEQVKHRRSLPEIKLVEKQLASGGDLDPRTMRIIEMYNSPAAPTLEKIGRQVGLTRQRVHQIIREAQGQGLSVTRRTPTMGHWIARCQICQRMRALAARQPLMTTRGIGQALDIPIWRVYWHLEKLKAQGLVPKHFGHFRSERIIQAIRLYNRNQSLSAWKLGQQLGYKNLPALFRELRRRGFGYLLFPRVKDEIAAHKLRFVAAEIPKEARVSSKSWGRKTAKRLPSRTTSDARRNDER